MSKVWTLARDGSHLLATEESVNKHILTQSCYVRSSPKPAQLCGRARLSHTIWQPWGPKHGQGPADYPVMGLS